ncbi:MAG: isoprenylcysteine carboxylmethyltransferase family protein [Isosphaeraceae bacterium]
MPMEKEPFDRRRLITSTAATLVVLLLWLFVPAGTLGWLRGWLFFVVTVVAGIVLSIYLRRVNPDIFAARVNRRTGTKSWDKGIVVLLISVMTSVIPVAALDDGRFHWSLVPWWVCAIGYALFLVGLVGMAWAEAVNKFFEPTVRIQTDRGHHVIDSGPYAIVRHPGYLSASPLVVGMALSLGSYWALIPAVLCCLILFVRTVLEDRTLQAELPGYREYAQRVRYRLMPGVW